MVDRCNFMKRGRLTYLASPKRLPLVLCLVCEVRNHDRFFTGLTNRVIPSDPYNTKAVVRTKLRRYLMWFVSLFLLHADPTITRRYGTPQ